ncbi:MAG: inorganic diphosphatase [Patescibacteria group bacterium]
MKRKFPEIIEVVIEIPKRSRNKYEMDPKAGKIYLDRVLFSTVFYPTDYGFIPNTVSKDGDPLDAMIIVSEPLFPGCFLKALPIGVLIMDDEEGKDEKIIAVAKSDPRLKSLKDISDLDDHLKREIKNFFETYKKLEKKPVNVRCWLNRKEALKRIVEARKKWQEAALEQKTN